MKNGGSHTIRKVVVLALVLFAGVTLAYQFMNGGVPQERNHATSGAGPAWIGHRIAEIPVFSFLPRWALNRWAIPISTERNSSVLKNVLEVFDPSLRPFLASVPIIFDSSATTARAYPAKGYISVSPDWDNTVSQSKYKALYEQRGMKAGSPVFEHRFKTDLLIHEFLHILQVHEGIDRNKCYDAISRWYLDSRYGMPSPNTSPNANTTEDGVPKTLATNRMKYMLWHQLYNYQNLSDVPLDEGWKNTQYGERYRSAKSGVEEFAYIGEGILSTGSNSENFIKTGNWSENDWKDKKMKLAEVSPEVIALYQGVFNPKLTR